MSEIYNRIIELCKEKKINGESNIYESISEQIYKQFGEKYPAESIRGISRRYRQQNNLDDMFNKCEKSECSNDSVVEFNKDGSQTSQKTIQVKKNSEITPELLLEKHGFQPDKFQLVSAKNQIWQGQKKGGTNQDFYSSRIVVKPKEDFSWSPSLIENIFQKQNIKPIKTKYDKHVMLSHKALIIPIVDLHWALHSYYHTTGNTYDENIAEGLVSYCINDILSRTQDKKFEKIIFIIGNDMVNYDNNSKTTTRGTPQDGQCPVEVAIEKVSDLLISCIEKLRAVQNVDVIYIPSNHDKVVGAGIANGIRMAYRECEDVNVDFRPIDRKYISLGRTLIGMAHDVDIKDINGVIQSDARHMLSNTDRTIYLLAHLHHEQCIDKNGTDIRRLPTVSALSRWSYEKGYSSQRKCQSFIVDYDKGITDVIYTVI